MDETRQRYPCKYTRRMLVKQTTTLQTGLFSWQNLVYQVQPAQM